MIKEGRETATPCTLRSTRQRCAMMRQPTAFDAKANNKRGMCAERTEVKISLRFVSRIIQKMRAPEITHLIAVKIMCFWRTARRSDSIGRGV